MKQWISSIYTAVQYTSSYSIARLSLPGICPCWMARPGTYKNADHHSVQRVPFLTGTDSRCCNRVSKSFLLPRIIKGWKIIRHPNVCLAFSAMHPDLIIAFNPILIITRKKESYAYHEAAWYFWLAANKFQTKSTIFQQFYVQTQTSSCIYVSFT